VGRSHNNCCSGEGTTRFTIVAVERVQRVLQLLQWRGYNAFYNCCSGEGTTRFVFVLNYFANVTPHAKSKFIEANLCILTFSANFVRNILCLIVTIIHRDIVIDVHRSSCKVPVILARFLIKIELSRRFLKNSSNTKFHGNPFS